MRTLIVKFPSTVLLFILVSMHFAYAGDHTFSFPDYDAAKKAESFLRFDMASTKLGLFTSHFSGYAKTFVIHGESKDNVIAPGTVIKVNANDLDTDIDGRNEKMWEKCLASKQHPVITIKITPSLTIDGKSTQVPATINLRGDDFPINLNVTADRKSDGLVVVVNGDLSIKALKLPDPSIAIASVRDTVNIVAHVTINEK